MQKAAGSLQDGLVFGFRSHGRCQGEAEELHKQALPRLQPHYRDRVPTASQGYCSAKACPHALRHPKLSQLQEPV